MSEHYLKTVEPYYSDVEQGYKDFEVRRNDRFFDVGDTLILQQCIDGKLTGKEIRRKIKYILFDENFVKERFCVLGLENAKTEPDERGMSMEWISVKDRLPSRDEQAHYLVYENNEITSRFWYGLEQDEEVQKSKWSNITHWMPLPEPPKED